MALIWKAALFEPTAEPTASCAAFHIVFSHLSELLVFLTLRNGAWIPRPSSQNTSSIFYLPCRFRTLYHPEVSVGKPEFMHIRFQGSLQVHSYYSYDSGWHLHCICLPLQRHTAPFCGILCRSGLPICLLKFDDIWVNTFALQLNCLHIFLYWHTIRSCPPMITTLISYLLAIQYLL